LCILKRFVFSVTQVFVFWKGRGAKDVFFPRFSFFGFRVSFSRVVFQAKSPKGAEDKLEPPF